MAGALAVLSSAPLLVWPAFLNGYPLVFIDTVSYLDHSVTGAAPWDKTQAYGLFLRFLHGGTSLWPVAAAQGLVAAHLLWLTQRVALGEARAGRHLVLVAGLATLTAAPWVIATVMPDWFAGIVVLALALLGFGEERLWRHERIWLCLLATLGIAAHLSFLPVAVAIAALVAAMRRRTVPALAVAAPAAAAVLFLLGSNAVAFGRPTLSPHGAVFLLARLQDDGPAARTIRDRCPAAGWYLCDFVDRLPMDSDAFLWDPAGPPARDSAGRDRVMGSMQLAPEAAAIVRATLVDHPGPVAWAMVTNGAAQLVRARIGDTLGNDHLALSARRGVALAVPREMNAFDAALQARGDLPDAAAPFLWPHAPVLWLAATLALLAWRRTSRAGDEVRLGVVLCVLVGLAANAGAAGSLSKPHDRYGARIIWLLPLAAVLGCWPRPVRGRRWGDIAPVPVQGGPRWR